MTETCNLFFCPQPTGTQNSQGNANNTQTATPTAATTTNASSATSGILSGIPSSTPASTITPTTDTTTPTSILSSSSSPPSSSSSSAPSSSSPSPPPSSSSSLSSLPLSSSLPTSSLALPSPTSDSSLSSPSNTPLKILTIILPLLLALVIFIVLIITIYLRRKRRRSRLYGSSGSVFVGSSRRGGGSSVFSALGLYGSGNNRMSRLASKDSLPAPAPVHKPENVQEKRGNSHRRASTVLQFEAMHPHVVVVDVNEDNRPQGNIIVGMDGRNQECRFIKVLQIDGSETKKKECWWKTGSG